MGKPVFEPLRADEHIKFCEDAHREIFRLNFGGEIPDGYLSNELERMRTHYAADPDSVVLAMLDGKRIGLASIELRSFGEDKFGWVNFFYIAPEFRGNGYGEQLLDYAAAHFRRLGLSRMFLHVGKTNTGALGFCLRNGFLRSPNGDRAAEFMLTKYLNGLPFDVDAAVRLYGEPLSHEVSDNSHGNDLRFTVIAEFPTIGKAAIKAARNAFTTPARIGGWARLAEHYNSLGIYAPRFLRNKCGDLCADVGELVVYAEEFTKYAPDELRDYEQSAEARLSLLGRVAANPLEPPLEFPAPYAMFDKFSDDDAFPEIYENGLTIIRRISEAFPEHSTRAAAIMSEYERRRAAFEPVYRALPKASFQADMNKTNLLFDGGRFAGLMDFNISGTDAVVAYALYESHYYMTEDEIRNAVISGDTSVIDARTRRNYGYIARGYAFSAAETAAFSELYSLAVPFWGANVETYHELLNEHGQVYVQNILDFIERALARRFSF